MSNAETAYELRTRADLSRRAACFMNNRDFARMLRRAASQDMARAELLEREAVTAN